MLFSFVNSQIRSPPIYFIIYHYIWRPLINPDHLKQRLGASLASAHLGKPFLSTLRMVEIRSLNISVLFKKAKRHQRNPCATTTSAIIHKISALDDISALTQHQCSHPTSVLLCDISARSQHQCSSTFFEPHLRIKKDQSTAEVI